MIESDADRLDMLRAVGETFSTGAPEVLWGVLDREYLEVSPGSYSAATRRMVLQCRSVDVALHGLVKDSKVTRFSDGAVFFVKTLEDDGTGMTVLSLKV